jgi:peptide-methionine (S)-S-oxide reductase
MLRLIASALGALLLFADAAAAQTQPTQPAPKLEIATFASGCFWCTESDFDKVKGVVETTSGYMGGKTPNPTYKQVSAGGTGHAEVLQLKYDPSQVSYKELLDVYWHNVDPLDGTGQFCDRGDQYRPAIFYHSEEQKRLAEESKAALEKSGRFNQPIVVEITAASTFTPAEDYHQDYHNKNPIQYFIYRHGCGRDARLEALWGKAKTH